MFLEHKSKAKVRLSLAHRVLTQVDWKERAKKYLEQRREMKSRLVEVCKRLDRVTNERDQLRQDVSASTEREANYLRKEKRQLETENRLLVSIEEMKLRIREKDEKIAALQLTVDSMKRVFGGGQDMFFDQVSAFLAFIAETLRIDIVWKRGRSIEPRELARLMTIVREKLTVAASGR